MFQLKMWQLLLMVYCSLGLSPKLWSQSSTLPTVKQAPNLSKSNIPALQSNASLNTQTLGLLRSMYGSSGGSMPSSRPAASVGTPVVPQSKPFNSYSPQPTVSPYLNLFRVDLNGNNDFNYSTLVQPQLQQRQLNQQLQEQALQNSRRVQSIAAQAAYNPEGAKDQYPTGHQTVFNYTGHYYPVSRPVQKAGR